MACTGETLTAFNSAGEPVDICWEGVTSVASAGDPLRGLDTAWFIVCGSMVFLMQVGFAMLEVGTVRPKSVENILFKNLGDASIGAIVWYFLGWGIAYGPADDPNDFMGVKDFTAGDSKDYRSFFFQWCFAATAATIISGAVAERITIQAYFLYTIVVTGFIYPVVVYWGWSSGFMWYDNDWGIIDFAGSGIVHMVGGFAGLVGAIVVGPRRGKPGRAHSVPFQVFGTLFLWFGWYGFNCGSTLGAQGSLLVVAERVAATTTLAAASGGLSSMFLAKLIEPNHPWDVSRMCNGVLGGLVSITAGCSVTGTGSAVAIGLIGGMVYYGSSKLVEFMGVDDVLDASPVHGFCGIWGLIAAALFSQEDLIIAAYGAKQRSYGDQLGHQFLGALIILVWTLGTSAIMFGVAKYTIGIQIDEETEKVGIDSVEHQGHPWNLTKDAVEFADLQGKAETEFDEQKVGV